MTRSGRAFEFPIRPERPPSTPKRTEARHALPGWGLAEYYPDADRYIPGRSPGGLPRDGVLAEGSNGSETEPVVRSGTLPSNGCRDALPGMSERWLEDQKFFQRA